MSKTVLSQKLEKRGWRENLDEIKKSHDVIAKHEILTEAVKHLFNTIDSQDILRKNAKGAWIFEDKELHKSEVEDLAVQALAFANSKLWAVLQKDIKYQLNKKMFLESRITEDVMWGKLLVFFNDIINTRLKTLK